MSCAVYSTVANLNVKDTLNEESEEKSTCTDHSDVSGSEQLQEKDLETLSVEGHNNSSSVGSSYSCR